jgi:hypothetical protein
MVASIDLYDQWLCSDVDEKGIAQHNSNPSNVELRIASATENQKNFSENRSHAQSNAP